MRSEVKMGGYHNQKNELESLRSDLATAQQALADAEREKKKQIELGKKICQAVGISTDQDEENLVASLKVVVDAASELSAAVTEFTRRLGGHSHSIDMEFANVRYKDARQAAAGGEEQEV